MLVRFFYIYSSPLLCTYTSPLEKKENELNAERSVGRGIRDFNLAS